MAQMVKRRKTNPGKSKLLSLLLMLCICTSLLPACESGKNGAENLDTPVTANSAPDSTPDSDLGSTPDANETSGLSDEDLDALLAEMTLEEKLGQMFIVSVDVTQLDEHTISMLKDYRVGNIIIFGKNVVSVEQVTALNQSLHEVISDTTGIPPFIGIDQEGGLVNRIQQEATVFSGNMASAATGNPLNAYLTGVYMGRELKEMGFSMNFAPSLDVNSNPKNPVIGVRSYSDDPKTAALFGNFMIKGLKKSGILPCAKHFPGHGDTALDSHYGLPLVDKSQEELWQTELYPFELAVKNNVPAIMTSHVIFPAFEEENIPATLSPKVLTGLLRDEMGFDGLVITDGMQMGAITQNYGISQGCLKAVLAGADMLLTGDGGVWNSNKPEPQYSAMAFLKEACMNGVLTTERIDESVKRILRQKSELGLFDNIGNGDKDDNAVDLNYSDWEAHRQHAQKVAEESITLIRDDAGCIPIQKGEQVLVISPKAPQVISDGTYENSLSGIGGAIFGWEHQTVSLKPDNGQIQAAADAARRVDKVVVGIYQTEKYPSQMQLANRITDANPNTIIISLDLPYNQSALPGSTAYLCAYDYTYFSCCAALGIINGDIESQGRLPVNLN